MIISRECRAAILTFVAGFGVMNAFYWFLTRPVPEVRGLYDYWAATVGDAFIVPLCFWSLVGAVDRIEHHRLDRRAATVGAILGATIGVSVVGAGLVDLQAEPNWTSPTPGTLTAPGLYHAAFLILAASAASALYGVLITRLHAQQHIPVGVTRRLMVASMASVAFSGLVLIDNASSPMTLSNLGSLAALCIGVTTLAVPWVLLARRRNQGRAAVR